MLWRSSADDLKSFSFAKLQLDLQRMSPFLFEIFGKITKESPHVACAAAAIALRGREPRLSAFAYYVDSVLLYGGAKKAVFKRLSKLGITTTHTNAVKKQKELAKTCGEDFHLLKVANEIFLNSDSVVQDRDTDTADGASTSQSMDTDQAPGSRPQGDTASARDLDEAIHDFGELSVLSGKKGQIFLLVFVVYFV